MTHIKNDVLTHTEIVESVLNEACVTYQELHNKSSLNFATWIDPI